jgi:hypothetical protein
MLCHITLRSLERAFFHRHAINIFQQVFTTEASLLTFFIIIIMWKQLQFERQVATLFPKHPSPEIKISYILSVLVDLHCWLVVLLC